MCQGSLLEASGESCTTWPRQGTWDRGFAWELPTSGPPTDASESSSLLPTPSAYESTPTDEYSEEVREHLLDTHRRLYLPGRKWHSQRTLSRMAGALLPTPVVSDGRGLTDGDSREGGASLRELEGLLPSPTAWLGRRPENAMADPERAASRQHEGARGKRSLELPDALAMLPTPTTQDAANTGGPSQHERNTPPLNAVASLLPTPAAADGSGGRLDSKETFDSGKRPSGTKATRTLRSTLHHKLPTLPTPVANPDNPGASRMLPTPTSQDARQNALNEAEAQRNPNTMWATMNRVSSGAHTGQPSSDGRPSSADVHPDQLTIEGG